MTKNMGLLNESVPGLRFGQKILTSEILGSGIVTFGNIWYVDSINGSDSNTGDTPETAFKTVGVAYAACTTNNNDVVLLSANQTSHKVSEMLTISKNRIHFIGLDLSNRKIGARSMISNTGAGAATDVAMVYITGTGNTFSNVAFKNNWTAAENLFAVKDFGIQSYFENCDIENLSSAGMVTTNTSASLNLGGNECQYVNCTIGADTTLITGSTSTAGQQVLVTNRGTSATKSTRSRFDNCRFQTYTSDSTHVFVRAATVSIDRNLTFNNCEFANTGAAATSGVDLAVAVATSATVGGYTNVTYPAIYHCSNLATSAVGATGVFVVSAVLAAAASDCVAVQAS